MRVRELFKTSVLVLVVVVVVVVGMGGGVAGEGWADGVEGSTDPG